MIMGFYSHRMVRKRLIKRALVRETGPDVPGAISRETFQSFLKQANVDDPLYIFLEERIRKYLKDKFPT